MAETLASEVRADTCPVADRGPPAAPLAFPDLDGDDERRMEDLMAARLFPRQAPALRIGRYTLLERIGQGGMGVVYAAYDPELDRRVAIKLLTAELADQAEARLLREAQAMARVVHANVVSVIEVGRHEGRTYVVMEHLRGISLDRWPERQAGWRATLRVYVQAGRGLAAAHRAGLIHRDFKPHNAMLVEGGVDDGRVKVLDFGLARAALHEPTRAPADAAPTGALAQPLTRTGALMGTPAYMAPEQLAGEPASARSDQFSFGVSLYEALHGQLPFAAGSLPELMHAVLSAAVRPPPSGSDVPGWVQRVVLRTLARRPEDRHDSMDALCDALERDPAARRRTVGLAAALSVGVGVGGWGLAQLEAASPCRGPGFAASEVWSEERADAVERAFAAAGLAYAAETADRVRPILGAYAEAWGAMRSEACEAHRRGEQSAQLLDLRIACLERRRAGLVALTDLFVAADGPLVERAVEAALELPSLISCADVTALIADTPVPEDSESAREVAATRVRLAEIGALASAGRLPAAAAAAEESITRAEALEFSPLIAEAALGLGAIALEQGRGEAADRALSLALRRGIAGRADRSAAEALIRRYFVRGEMLGQPQRVAAEEELVVAHAARFPRDGGLQWLAANNRGVVAYRNDDFERARALYRSALAVTDGPTPLELARTRINLGLLEYEARDFEAALTSYRAAVAEAGAALGEGHPLVDQLVMYEASALMELGRKQAARARLEAVLRRPGSETDARNVWPMIRLSLLDGQVRRHDAARAWASRALARTDASDALTLINAETSLADALTDPDAARAQYASVLARCAATYGESHAITANFQRRAGAGLLRLARPTEALPLLRRSLATCERLDPAATTTAESRQLLADALLAVGEPGEALASARAAVATLLALPGDHALDLALARRSLGRAQLARGEADAALASVRAALEALEPRLDADDPDLAATRVELAQASLAADPASAAAASAQLTQARDVYAALGEPFAPERGAAERMLAALPGAARSGL